MKRRKKSVERFNYECSITGKSFTTTRKAPNPDELVSINAYYELHPEEDDRPEVVKLEEERKSQEAEAADPFKDLR